MHQIMLCGVAAQAVEMIDDADAGGRFDATAHIRGRNADLLGDGVRSFIRTFTGS